MGKKFLLLCAFVFSAGLVAAQSHKISSDLQGSTTPQVNVIVQYNQPVSSAMHAKVIRRGGALKHEFSSIRGGAYTMPSAQLESLAADPAVRYISPDRPLHSLLTSGGTVPALDHHLESVGAASAWSQGLTGAGIGVAVIDSGVTAVDDLPAGKIVYSQNFADDGGSSATDLYGHGTHVGGIIAGSGKDSTGSAYTYTFQGIAPEST